VMLVGSDYNGNTTSYAGVGYSYDEENRLYQAAPTGGGTTLGQYFYDAFGRRISKIDNFGVQTFFYYDGWRTLEEQSSPGVTTATYVFGNYLDEALTMDRGGETYYYHQNALWSTFALTDSNGDGVEGYQYDAYGYQTLVLPGMNGLDFGSDDTFLPGAESSVGNPFLFTEQRYDPETGLLYYKNRYYSTFFGRFMQRDPAEYADSMNLYEYAGDNPVGWDDPYGLDYLPEAQCATAMQKRKDKIANLQKGDRSDVGKCDSPDCKKVTYIVELAHSCEADLFWSFVGHTGIAVGDDYFDFGPNGGARLGKTVPGKPWWHERDKVKGKLSDLLTNLKDVTGGKEDVLKIEQCVCAAQATGIQDYWTKLYKQIKDDDRKSDYCIPGLHCTSAALNSAKAVIEPVAKEVLKTDKIGDTTWSAVYPELALTVLGKLSHLCGSNKDKTVKIDHIQKEQKP